MTHTIFTYLPPVSKFLQGSVRGQETQYSMWHSLWKAQRQTFKAFSEQYLKEGWKDYPSISSDSRFKIISFLVIVCKKYIKILAVIYL